MSRRPTSAEARTGYLFGSPPRETPMPRTSLAPATPVWRENLHLSGEMVGTDHLTTSDGRPLCDPHATILARGTFPLSDRICQACRVRAASREFGPLGAEIVR